MNRRILIADDDKTQLRYLRGIFKMGSPLNSENIIPFKVETFHDGAPLAEFLKSEFKRGERIPLCILDMRMPMGGLQTAEAVRAIDPEVFIIFTTHYSDINPSELMKSFGKDVYYLRKPLRVEELLAQVTALLTNWNNQQALKSAYRKVDQTRRHLQAILNHSPTVIAQQDTMGRYEMVNQRFTDICRLPREEMIGRTDEHIFPPLTAEERVRNFRKVIETGKLRKFEELLPVDGVMSEFLTVQYPIHDENKQIVSVGTMSSDISEFRRAEKVRKEMEFIVNKSPTVACLLRADENWSVEFITDNVQQFGYVPEDFYSSRLTYKDIIHADDLDRVQAEIGKYTREGSNEFSQIYRIVENYGEVCWVEDNTWIRRNLKGAVTHYQGVITDITKRKRAEETLRENEAYLKTIMETIHTGVIIKDPVTFEIVDANPCAAQMFGCSIKELIGRDFYDFRCLEGVELPPSAISCQHLGSNDYVVQTDDNKKIQVRRSVAKAVMKDREYLVQSLLDITDIKHLLKKQEISIDLAKKLLGIINGIVPRYTEISRKQVLFVDSIYAPCYKEGGDHYFVRNLAVNAGDTYGKTIISLKDQSGHEVGCILRSIITDLTHHKILNDNESAPLEDIIFRLNDEICHSGIFQNEDFFTSVNAEIDRNTLELKYVSTGHPRFFLIRGNRIMSMPEPGEPGRNPPMALSTGMKYSVGTYQLQKNDKLLFYTDGLTEIPVKNKKTIITYDEMGDIIAGILSNDPLPPVSDIMYEILNIVSKKSDVKIIPFSKNTSHDDITILCLEIEDQEDYCEIALKPESSDDLNEKINKLYLKLMEELNRRGYVFPDLSVRSVLTEAVINAWIHGNKRDQTKSVTICWRFGNDFHMEIIDQGDGFDYKCIPDPKCEENITKPSGRGLFIIRKFSSHVSWKQGGRHLCVYFKKYRNPTVGNHTAQNEKLMKLWDHT
ncbi:MAG: PAS domain S-box protein [Desulfobacteraceae bacterium]|nr:PAS domain S-box protein [Desulfobacteraceae bacterium]